jgi:hypothetical protein
MVIDDESRIAVLTPATATGSLWPWTGNHSSPVTTLMKK